MILDIFYNKLLYIINIAYFAILGGFLNSTAMKSFNPVEM